MGSPREQVQQALAAGGTTTAAALELFDALPVVEVEAMLGSWEGQGFPTGHPLDGLLEAFHWRGKRFDSPEDGHPLVFTGPGGGEVALDPGRIGPLLALATRVPMPRSGLAGRLFQLCTPLLSTSHSRSRLRMIRHRDRTSATMVYDQLPILDVFRRIDDDTLLGLMDGKGMAQPFFFLLRRADAPHRTPCATSPH
ncbi:MULTISPECIES: DUF4334 domain-containing protein [Aphanothece]|uniref:DUF4334 domain-containing protein n=1 Tax=Aphanothece TaxID=1121 RepID=UPI00398532DD